MNPLSPVPIQLHSLLSTLPLSSVQSLYSPLTAGQFGSPVVDPVSGVPVLPAELVTGAVVPPLVPVPGSVVASAVVPPPVEPAPLVVPGPVVVGPADSPVLPSPASPQAERSTKETKRFEIDARIAARYHAPPPPPRNVLHPRRMLDERDTRAPAWAWLRGFAWFLLAWPLLSLLALDRFDFSEWEAIVIAVLGPPAIGLVLLAIDAALTRLFGRRAAAAAQPVPDTLRDVSNLGIAMAILLVVDVLLVTFFDDDPMIKGGDPRAATLAVTLLAIFSATAIVFRGASRLLRGRPRVVDLGPGWDRAPNLLRFLGYLTLIPMLLVCTVMIDYELHQKPGFELAAWIALPALLWLGLRSATARAPRWWAKNPWEAWQRRVSLALPWWIAGVALALGFAALCLLMPFGLVDPTITTRGKIVAGIVMGPLGLIVLGGAAMMLWRGVPNLLREWRIARLLARQPDRLAAWSTTSTAGQVRVQLKDRREAVFEMGEEAQALIAWLGSR